MFNFFNYTVTEGVAEFHWKILELHALEDTWEEKKNNQIKEGILVKLLLINGIRTFEVGQPNMMYYFYLSFLWQERQVKMVAVKPYAKQF